ncbi:MAG: HAD-IIB family hydrolase [SAR324 cluster bacterium]|nr:HAD-IIB family hydrolase [SAR324 cluster bacterium]
MNIQWIVASDIDGTLTGDREALNSLGHQISLLRKKGELRLFLVTGRRLDQVLEGFQTEGIPESDAIISQVGTEIFMPPYSRTMSPMPEWETKLRSQFSRAQAVSFLEGIEGLEMQPDVFNTPLKVSAYLDKAPDPDKAAAKIQERVLAFGTGYQVIWSSGRDLDILPSDSGKGKAIWFLMEHLKLTQAQLVVAGDTGNDCSMFAEMRSGVVVCNATPELKQFVKSHPSLSIYQAREKYAAGVAEGLRHFGVIQ